MLKKVFLFVLFVFTSGVPKAQTNDSLKNKKMPLFEADKHYKDEEYIASLTTKYGDIVVDNITYKVQVGAYRFINNFDFNKLLQLPAVRRQVYEDGITRFTLGEYKTIKEADSVCQQARKVAVKDAFVIPLYKNKRTTFEELIKSNYFKK